MVKNLLVFELFDGKYRYLSSNIRN